MTKRVLAALVIVGVACLPARQAWSHCTMPDVIRPMVRAAAPNEINLFMTFGSGTSANSGSSWLLQCEEVYQPATEPFGPSNQWITPNGTLVAAHVSGLLVSRDAGCTFQKALGTPVDPGSGEPRPVVDVALNASDPDRRFWLTIDQTLYRSDDAGANVTMVRRFTGHNLLQLANHPTDGNVFYFYSFTEVDGGGLAFYINSSLDGGATFEQNPSPYSEDLYWGRVAPDNPRKIYFVRGSENQKVYVSIDRGRTATEIFDAASRTGLSSGFSNRVKLALGAAARELWIGVRGDDMMPASSSLWHSTDDGATWTKVATAQPHFRCLEFMQGKLWGCGNNILATGDTFAVGSSENGGQTWTKRFAFGELCTAITCATTACAPIFASQCVPGLCSGGQDGGTGGTGGTGGGGTGGMGGGGMGGGGMGGGTGGMGGSMDGARDAGSDARDAAGGSGGGGGAGGGSGTTNGTGCLGCSTSGTAPGGLAFFATSALLALVTGFRSRRR